MTQRLCRHWGASHPPLFAVLTLACRRYRITSIRTFLIDQFLKVFVSIRYGTSVTTLRKVANLAAQWRHRADTSNPKGWLRGVLMGAVNTGCYRAKGASPC